MHMLNLLFFVGAVAARGFTIPEGTPNGVYKVTYDAEGEATHTFIGNTTIEKAQVADLPKVKARSSREDLEKTTMRFIAETTILTMMTPITLFKC